jgi:hypothetical protein
MAKPTRLVSAAIGVGLEGGRKSTLPSSQPMAVASFRRSSDSSSTISVFTDLLDARTARWALAALSKA